MPLPFSFHASQACSFATLPAVGSGGTALRVDSLFGSGARTTAVAGVPGVLLSPDKDIAIDFFLPETPHFCVSGQEFPRGSWDGNNAKGASQTPPPAALLVVSDFYALKEFLSGGLRMKLTTHRSIEAPTIAVTQLPICQN